MTKDEKIEIEYTKIFKNLYFTDYQKGIDEDGWYSNERNDRWLPILQEIPLFDFRNNNTEIRPKSLSGIENNNSWIRIESENDLPKQSNNLWLLANDGSIILGQWCIFQNIFKTTYGNDFDSNGIYFTHYQKIQIPQLPLY